MPRVDETGSDTLDCAVWLPKLQRRALQLPADVPVDVEGRLRRRWWRAGAGVASRTEIEVQVLRRVGRAR
ncbi:hypothetical protein [Angustibacter aerolatus]